MGKTDAHLFPHYKRLFQKKGDVVAIAGGTVRPPWLEDCPAYELYDREIDGWSISNPVLNTEYDNIICTRVAYFSDRPLHTIKTLAEHLKPGGQLLIDWGVGDHWRFRPYSVGWVRGQVHEWAYQEGNLLWSAYYDTDMEYQHQFKANIKQHGYEGQLIEHLRAECPELVLKSEIEALDIFEPFEATHIDFWQDYPQLYSILPLIKK